MNLLGKIFVVLILLMSVMFAAFSVAVYSTHKNWKTEAEARQKTIGTLNEQLTAAQAEKTKLDEAIAREKVAHNEALAKLETERVELAKQRDALTTERDGLLAKDKDAVAALDAAQQNLKKLTGEVDALREEIRVAQSARDKSFDQVVRLTDQIHQVQGELTRLEERDVQLADQLAQSKQVLSAHGLTKDTPVDNIPPQLRGKVLAINREDMIEVSLGSDDGLRAGHKLEVFRGSHYLGRVEVLNTSSDRAVAKIIPGFKKAAIQRGDDVATRFSVI
jgi:hypothetical protein